MEVKLYFLIEVLNQIKANSVTYIKVAIKFNKLLKKLYQLAH